MEASRPHVPDYGIPTDRKRLLQWEHVTERLVAARNYWIVTVSIDGRPHAVPTWGVWVNEQLGFGGGPRVRWARNIASNPNVAVHLEDGSDVVILEGRIDDQITDASDARLAAIDDAYEAKYEMRHGPIIRLLTIERAFAWTKFPDDTTRWTFG